MKKLFKKIKAWYKDNCQRPDDWENMSQHDRRLFTISAFAAFAMVMCPILIAILIALLCAQSCAGPSKIQRIQTEQMQASIGLVEEAGIKQMELLEMPRPDTLVVHDDDGREFIIMKAVKDENGEMVATDVINAAVVEARFRNVAERHGKVDIEFQIRVPQDMQDEAWQLRFYPRMHILGDTLNLEQVIITGAKYRKAQLRGYQQYEKYLASIVTDSTRFINMRLLELFIQRNIPDLYAFKADSTEVADESFNAILDTKVASNFASQYGVTGRDAIEHYTNTISKRLNARRWEQREKIDVVLSGDIFEQDRRLYEIPATEPLTYYISSLSAFVDGTPRYKKQIISRRVEANTACYIDFEQGSDVILEDLSNNRFEMSRIKRNLGSLIENKDFDLDSIVVTASCSPEGSLAHNTRLSQRRSESVSRYFSQFIRAYRDSLREEMLEHIYFDGAEYPRETQTDIKFISRSNPENWRMLDVLVADSDSLLADQKRDYTDICRIEDLDARENELSKQTYYRFMREILYPRLRTVKFDFHLHRKGMVKDTLQTTVLDEEYMAGVQAIRNRDYETAIQILRPYKDYNAAVAFCAMDYNASALDILEALPETDQVHYLLAVIYSRQGREEEAVEHYLKACKMTPSYIHRGNLDPEISELIKRYNLTNNYFQTH